MDRQKEINGFQELEFNNKKYVGRTVKSNDGEELLIAGTDYLDVLQPGEFGDENDGFASKEASDLYDEVFYFVSPKDLKLPDNELIKILKDANPDSF